MSNNKDNLPAAVAGQPPCENAAYRVGRTLGTTIYNVGEDQPCVWVPDNKALALHIAELLNRDARDQQHGIRLDAAAGKPEVAVGDAKEPGE